MAQHCLRLLQAPSAEPQAIVRAVSSTLAPNGAAAAVVGTQERTLPGSWGHPATFGAPPRSLDSLGAAAGPGPRPLVRRFLCCPVHPEDPLQYFCLGCQTECVCAECVLNGDHRGHEVLNVREAVQLIPERLAELADAARLRAQELATVIESVREGRQEIADMAGQGRHQLHSAFERLACILQEEEEAILAEVGRCSADVLELLNVDDDAQLREAHAMLQRHQQLGNVPQTLNWYARLKNLLATPAAQPAYAHDVGDDADPAAPLKAQLQRGFEKRFAGIAEVGRGIAELSSVAWPPSEPEAFAAHKLSSTFDVTPQPALGTPRLPVPCHGSLVAGCGQLASQARGPLEAARFGAGGGTPTSLAPRAP